MPAARAESERGKVGAEESDPGSHGACRAERERLKKEGANRMRVESFKERKEEGKRVNVLAERTLMEIRGFKKEKARLRPSRRR